MNTPQTLAALCAPLFSMFFCAHLSRGHSIVIALYQISPPPAIVFSTGTQSNAVLETIADLRQWSPLVNVYTATASGSYRDLESSNETPRFYRVGVPGLPVSEARDLWENQNMASYRFRFSRVCLCEPNFTLSGTAIVSDGEVQEVVDVKGQGGLPVENPDLSEFKRIEQLFDILEQETYEADEVYVRFEPELGYPSKIKVDSQVDMVDDEVQYEVTELEELTGN
jgi:hypothetical protein